MQVAIYNLPVESKEKNLSNRMKVVKSIAIVPTIEEKSIYADFIAKIYESIDITEQGEFSVISLEEFSQIRYDITLKSHKCLLLVFGLSPQDIHFQINHFGYELMTIGGFTFLFTDALEKLSTERALKVSLWNALKPLSSA